MQGPPTPDGKLAIVAAPTRYDYAAKKELFDNFLQVVDIEAMPPRLLAKVDVDAHANGLTINREGTLLLAAAHDGTVKVLAIEGKNVKRCALLYRHAGDFPASRRKAMRSARSCGSGMPA